MRKIFRYLLIIFGSLLLFGVIVSILVKVYEEYEKRSWTPPTEIKGVYLGMTRSDLLFKFEYRCWEPSEKYSFSFLSEDSDGVTTCDHMGTNGLEPSVRLKNDVVTKLTDSINLRTGGYTVEEIQNRLGEPDILTINEDLSGRVYTYLDHQLSMSFTRNELGVYQVGDLVWGDVRWNKEDKGEIFIRGELVCPSTNCPFNEDGSLKDDYPYKTPFDFPL